MVKIDLIQFDMGRCNLLDTHPVFCESIDPCRSGAGTAKDILGPLFISVPFRGPGVLCLTPRIKAATEKSQHEATLAAQGR